MRRIQVEVSVLVRGRRVGELVRQLVVERGQTLVVVAHHPLVRFSVDRDVDVCAVRPVPAAVVLVRHVPYACEVVALGAHRDHLALQRNCILRTGLGLCERVVHQRVHRGWDVAALDRVLLAESVFHLGGGCLLALFRGLEEAAHVLDHAAGGTRELRDGSQVLALELQRHRDTADRLVRNHIVRERILVVRVVRLFSRSLGFEQCGAVILRVGSVDAPVLGSLSGVLHPVRSGNGLPQLLFAIHHAEDLHVLDVGLQVFADLDVVGVELLVRQVHVHDRRLVIVVGETAGTVHRGSEATQGLVTLIQRVVGHRAVVVATRALAVDPLVVGAACACGLGDLVHAFDLNRGAGLCNLDTVRRGSSLALHVRVLRGALELGQQSLARTHVQLGVIVDRHNGDCCADVQVLTRDHDLRDVVERDVLVVDLRSGELLLVALIVHECDGDVGAGCQELLAQLELVVDQDAAGVRRLSGHLRGFCFGDRVGELRCVNTAGAEAVLSAHGNLVRNVRGVVRAAVTVDTDDRSARVQVSRKLDADVTCRSRCVGLVERFRLVGLCLHGNGVRGLQACRHLADHINKVPCTVGVELTRLNDDPGETFGEGNFNRKRGILALQVNRDLRAVQGNDLDSHVLCAREEFRLDDEFGVLDGFQTGGVHRNGGLGGLGLVVVRAEIEA